MEKRCLSDDHFTKGPELDGKRRLVRQGLRTTIGPCRGLAIAKQVDGDEMVAVCKTLLRNSADERISPFPRRIYPTAFVTGMPRAVYPFRIATRT